MRHHAYDQDLKSTYLLIYKLKKSKYSEMLNQRHNSSYRNKLKATVRKTFYTFFLAHIQYMV